MRKLIILSWFIFSIVDSSCTSKSGDRKEKNISQYWSVKKIIDGDTFWANNQSNEKIKIRLIGVDAPESKNIFKKKKGYFGIEAKEFLTNLLKGKQVKLEFDVDPKDQYGRTLAYVYLEDGTFVNAELVKKGYAQILTIPPNVKYAAEFLKLQKEARENNRGLWNLKN